MNRKTLTVAVCAAFAAVLAAPMLLAQTPGAAASFAVLGGTSVTAAAGATQTLINGDVGVSPGAAITGFPANATTVPPYSTHANDAAAIAAQAATLALYNNLAGPPAGTPLPAQLNGQVIGPGRYDLGAADLAATGNLTLSGAGLYVFRVASTLVANVGSTVTLFGVDPCQVYWQVTSAATLNGVNFVGTVVAQAAVDLGSNAILAGRALTTSLGAVTLAGGNRVNGCGGPPATPFPAAPGVDLIITKTHAAANFVVGTNGTFLITASNIGGAASAGVFTVVDTLPAGLTFVSASGTGWTCAAVGQVVTCTNATPLAPGNSSVPISLVVAVGAGAVPIVTNTAVISGGGDTVLTNNTTVDVVPVSTAVPPVPTMAEWATIGLIGLLSVAGFVALRRRKSAPAAG